jgi:hypothetical protein
MAQPTAANIEPEEDGPSKDQNKEEPVAPNDASNQNADGYAPVATETQP